MNLTVNRHADHFDRLLGSDARSDDPVTGPLLTLAEALRALPTVDGPAPEFRSALRQRLVAVATVQGVDAPAQPALTRVRAAGSTWKVQRRVTALAASAAVVTGVVGMGAAAAKSLPGDPFYGVKQAAEATQLAATFGTEARGKRHLQFAATRLAEVHDLAKGAPSATESRLVISTLHAMDVQTSAGATDLFAAFKHSTSTEPLRALDRFARTQYSGLSQVMANLPAGSQPAARASLALLQLVAGDTDSVARAAAGGTNVPAPTTSNPATPGISPTAPAPGASLPAVTPSGPASGRPSSGSSGQQLTPPGIGSSTVPTSGPSLPNVIPTIPQSVTPPAGPLPTELPSLPDVGSLFGG